MIIFLKLLFYRLKGRKPWSRGYIASRTDFLKKIFLGTPFDFEKVPEDYGVGFDERVIEYPWMFSRLSKNPTHLLDAGSVLNFDYILDHPVLEKKNITISTLAPEQNCFWFRNVSYVFEDFRQSFFKDNHFDEIICLSTLEHVGLDNEIYTVGAASGARGDSLGKSPSDVKGSFVKAISELKRILKPGGKLYLSMPFGKPINHGWLQVFDHCMVDQIYAQFSSSHKKEWIFLYTASGWKLSNREESKNAIYFDKHKLDSKAIDTLAAAESVICIEMTKG